MADWDRVERLRSKGWDWDRIAGDEKVDFHAEEGAGDPGRALRTLYYQRRSRQQRRPSGGSKGSDADATDDLARPRWTLARIGLLLTPLVGLWFVLAYFFPSPVGVYVSAIPVLAVALFASAAVLAFGLLRTADRWNSTMRNTVAIGCVLGLVIAGGFGLAAISQGCPSLTSSSSSEPDSFIKADNGAWQQNGAPVFFFYGASGCPYCSASSWSMWYALKAFGTVSGVQYGYSSATDIYPSTPEIILAYLSVQSPYVSFVSAENLDGQAVGPTPSSCVQQAYVSAYDTSGIPFIVLNGQYYHQGTLVDPSQLAGMTGPEVMGQMQNQSGVAWTAISPAAYWMMAFLVKLNDGAPSSVASISQVQSDLSQISQARRMDARTLHAVIPIAIVAGLILSGYAAYESTHPSAQGSCSINGFVSCSKVDNSAHTTTFGVHDYWLGIAGFLALLVVDVPLLRTYKASWLYALVGLSTVGVVFSVYLAYIELDVIDALCLICTGSYLSNLTVWIAGMGLVWERRSADRDVGSDPREPGPSNGRRPSD